MAEWCADHLRDCIAWKNEGLELSTTNNEAAKLYDGAIRQVVSWMNCERLGGIERTIHGILEADPDMIMGRVLALGLDSLGTGKSIRLSEKFRSKMLKLVYDADRFGNSREKKHAKAVNYFANGDMLSACVEWEKILAEHPTDLMALKFAHDGYFFLGKCYDKRDSVDRVINKWDPNLPCYSYLHGMYAFGLEECGEYEKSEKHARKGLELQPKDCWSTHAVAHCMEMTGRFREGIQFMESTIGDWEPCFMLACHNFWHNTLFYIEEGDYESAMSIYDREIGRRSKAGHMLDIVDAASLLVRLELEGVDVGGRWRELVPVVSPHMDDHCLAFNDAHISMVLARYDEDNLSEKHLNSIGSFITTGSGDQRRLLRDIGGDICLAVNDFNRGQYSSCFNKLYPIRNQIFQIGGSHAQRDVFTQLLINSAIRSDNPEIHQKTLPLIEERNQLKQNSPLAARLAAHQKGSWTEALPTSITSTSFDSLPKPWSKI
uniref:Tetratricopeptide repeat protein 38 n=1 Tax=Acrobeloides nanus TaxID=290746 RepID=A0A914DY36_9BILA